MLNTENMNRLSIQIGKDFDVSDNTIRKWCDGYKLPRRKADIKSYSKEE